MDSNDSFAYDNNGNTLTDASGRTYQWDVENRLTSVTKSGSTTTFKYDPFGRRIQKSSSSATTNYIYDGANVIEQLNSAGAILNRFTDTQNVDEPLAITSSGVSNFYEQDGLGSVTSLTNSSGSLSQTYTFDSFGNTTASSGSVANPYQYTAREFDSETGLYYYRARYYDPSIGRFVTEDPLAFNAGIDFYVYVGNVPTEYIDPFGQVRYNKPPPWTVPVTGATAKALDCLEHCLRCLINNPSLNLLVTGGAEQVGHTKHSYHYLGQAVDISFYNPVSTQQVFQCGEYCGFTAGQAEPAKHHWHLQLTPGNGAKVLPALLPMEPPCAGKCQR